MTVSLIWRETALDDLDVIVEYIGLRDFGAANKLQATIEACAERLVDHPYLYRTGRIAGTREAVVHPNYVLVYRVGGRRGRSGQRDPQSQAIPAGRVRFPANKKGPGFPEPVLCIDRQRGQNQPS